MFYSEDGNTFSWNLGTDDQADPRGPCYEFPSTVPLSIKKSLVQSVNDALGRYLVSDIFGTSEQLQWVAGILRMGMQLPVEDTEIAYAAFKQYSNIAFALHGQRLRHNTAEPAGDGASVYSDPATLEALIRPSILFNPRVFFAQQLPVEKVHEQPGKGTGLLRVSNVIQHAPKVSSAVAAAVVTVNEPASAPPTPVGTSADQRFVSSPTTVDNQPPATPHSRTDPQLRQAPPAMRSTRRTLSPAQMLKALDLWDQYVALLDHVFQVYSTMIRGLQPLIPRETMSTIFSGIMSVIDMLLSQGSNNPQLAAWRKRYRPLVGPRLWDQTWETLGDRLELQAVKLLLDVWSRMPWHHAESDQDHIRNIRYWVHRDKLVEAWVAVFSQLLKRALRVAYPHDKSVGVEQVRVHFSGYSVTAATTGAESVEALFGFASVPMDYDSMSPDSYAAFGRKVCSAIDFALSIEKVVEVDGVQCAQVPPSANYVLCLFGESLFTMALRDCGSSAKLVMVQHLAIAVLARLLTKRESPRDPMLPQHRNRILYTICQAMDAPHSVQAVLPSAALLLKNTRYVRPFIPKMYDLVLRVLPKGCGTMTGAPDHMLRRSAYEAISALTGFVGYYHHIGRSDMIPNTQAWLDENRRRNSDMIEETPATQLRAQMVRLVNSIEGCVFEKSAQRDAVFRRYLRCIFQSLMLSIATEESRENLQYGTCIALAFLQQYVRSVPGYLGVFVEFFVCRLQTAQDDNVRAVYIYGLLQAAMVAGASAVPDKQCTDMVSAVVHALADCDRDLALHTQWHPYHQVFISSLRCLSYWMSTLSGRPQLPDKLVDQLQSLLDRCSKFIAMVQTDQDNSPNGQERRLMLTTSNIDIAHSRTWRSVRLHRSIVPRRPARGTSSITAFTLLGLLKSSETTDNAGGGHAGKDDDEEPQRRRPFAISASLCATLYTAISVYSAVLARKAGDAMAYTQRALAGPAAIRRALRNEPMPPTRDIVRNLSPAVTRYLEDFVATRVRLITTSNMAIYTVIDLVHPDTRRRNRKVIYMAGRFVCGTKEWVLAASPLDDSAATDADAEKPESLSAGPEICDANEPDWIRRGECPQEPEVSGSESEQTVPGAPMGFIESMIDQESVRAIDRYIDKAYQKLHTEKYASDIRFAPAQPPQSLARADTFDRALCTELFGADFGFLNVTEEVLGELSQLDDMDRPFSAQAGIIYLQSSESLSTKRNICRGPLCGVSADFRRFVDSLDRCPQVTVDHVYPTSGSAPLMRRVFMMRDFKVCYDFAPNVSALASDSTMDPRDNAYFYDLLRERGIVVIWFDSYAGSLDIDLAWQYIDQLQHDSGDPSRDGLSRSEQGQPDVVAATTKINHAHTPPPPRSTGASTATMDSRIQSEPPQAKPPSKGTDTDRQRLARSTRKPLPRCASQPCRIAAAMLRCRANRGAQETEARMSAPPAEVLAKPPFELIAGLDDSASSSGGNSNGSNGSSQRTDVDNGEQASQQSQGPVNTRAAPSQKSTGRPAHEPRKPSYSWSERDRSLHNSPSSAVETDAPEYTVRVLIALAPVADTQGRLLKVAVSASGGPSELNRDFERLTGPLMTNMLVPTADIACMLSSTILDAAANRASLQGGDFSMVYRRAAMVSSIIERYGIHHESIDDAHKFMFPVGKSGVQCAFDIVS
ncbi:hypothetical protein H4R19_000628 [Coemansia spiralis]|nr:hypothetical protein H4R19_000628 [Coemansia spiralis]